jgi:hypothetical protein
MVQQYADMVAHDPQTSSAKSPHPTHTHTHTMKSYMTHGPKQLSVHWNCAEKIKGMKSAGGNAAAINQY